MSKIFASRAFYLLAVYALVIRSHHDWQLIPDIMAGIAFLVLIARHLPVWDKKQIH